MPFFRYIAADASGRVLEGTLQASSGQEATQLLQRQGLQVTQLSGSGSAASAVVKPPSAPPASSGGVVLNAVAAGRSAAVGSLRPEVSPAPVVNSPRPVTKPAVKVVHTKKSRDKNLLLIFSQLAAYFRAGMDPRRAFEDVAYKCPVLFRESLLEVSKQAGEGFTMSDVLERYPDLYPPHVVGIVRAGEQAGFLPEAFQEVADWALPSWKLKRAMAVFNNVAVMLIVGFPLGLACVNGSLNSWDAQEASGGETPVGPLLARLVGKASLPLILPTALILGIYYVGRFYWRGDTNRLNRHRLLLAVPILGKRARAESLRLFSYALSLTSRAGLSPHSAFVLAADAMPNLEMSERLKDNAAAGDTSTKLTVLLKNGNVVPTEYRNVIETGEITGDVPGAAMHIADASNIEFQSADGSTKYVKTFLSILVFGAGIILFMLLYKFFLLGEFSHILGND